jgi:hypothetical protein
MPRLVPACSMRPMTARLLLLLAVLLLAACGGGSSSTSSDPGSKDYDPAHTTLKKAGLEVCNEVTKDVPPTITNLPGLGATRAFVVAKSCDRQATPPDTVYIFQFTNTGDATTGAATIKRTLGNAAVLEHYPLVIATIGANKDANLAAIEKQLPPSAVTTTS